MKILAETEAYLSEYNSSNLIHCFKFQSFAFETFDEA